MYVFGSGRCGWRGGEWMRELGYLKDAMTKKFFLVNIQQKYIKQYNMVHVN